MNKQYMERCIQKAGTVIEAQRDHLLKQKDGVSYVTSEILAKAAGFGPTVVQLGIKPAVAVYSDTSKKNEVAVLNAIFEILKAVDTNDEDLKASRDLNEYLRPKQSAALRITREHIVSASVALKLMLRTYEEWKENRRNQGSEDA